MLRTALSDGLTTQSSVLKFIGERFRPRADLPEWTSDEDITRHLLKYARAYATIVISMYMQFLSVSVFCIKYDNSVHIIVG